MADLYPTFAVPEVSATSREAGVDYKGSVFFDFEKGDFSLDTTGRMVNASGVDAWKQWCLVAIHTQRSAFIGYGRGFGVEGEEAFSQPDQKSQEAALQSTITGAIMADPYKRTRNVQDFVFTWKTDSVDIAFSIVGCAGNIEKIQANLKGGVTNGDFV